jgi:hypothetical protein
VFPYHAAAGAYDDPSLLDPFDPGAAPASGDPAPILFG